MAAIKPSLRVHFDGPRNPRSSASNGGLLKKRIFSTAAVRYGGFTQQRTVLFRKPGELVITDEVSGPAGLHDIEQFWHFDVGVEQVSPTVLRAARARISFLAEETVELIQRGEHGWRSQISVPEQNRRLPIAAVELAHCLRGLSLLLTLTEFHDTHVIVEFASSDDVLTGCDIIPSTRACVR